MAYPSNKKTITASIKNLKTPSDLTLRNQFASYMDGEGKRREREEGVELERFPNYLYMALCLCVSLCTVSFTVGGMLGWMLIILCEMCDSGAGFLSVHYSLRWCPVW